MIGSEFSSFYSAAIAVAFTAADFASGGAGYVILPLGPFSFRLDATAGSFAQNTIYLHLGLNQGPRLIEASALCVPGTPSTTPLTGNLFGPKGGGLVAIVNWDGVAGTISGGWTMPK